MSVACSASLKFVQCMANFALCVSLEKSIFQELLETAQTIGFIMPLDFCRIFCKFEGVYDA